jgi:hypothetical protein
MNSKEQAMAHVHIERTPPGPRAEPPRDQIEGWGADLDRSQRPAYPMERTPPRLDTVPPPLLPQLAKVEILHSTERPGITPVFGTSTPPSGLSGMMRRGAFKFSENDIRHWLILLAADRVNVAEGLLEDLSHGHVPNIFKEMGGPAEFRFNRAGAMRKLLIATALTTATVYMMRRKRR